MNSNSREIAESKDREIKFSRVFVAPRDLVFDAWTSPDKIGEWWGPNGFTTTTHEMDFKPGGVWRFTMQGPDGTDYPNRIVYTSINKNEYLTYDHYGHEDKEKDPPHFKARVTFQETAGKTKVTMQLLFPTPEARNNATEFGAIEGGNQTLARLEQYLKAT